MLSVSKNLCVVALEDGNCNWFISQSVLAVVVSSICASLISALVCNCMFFV